MKRQLWLQRLLNLPSRPLQIPEILKSAEEHLQVAAMEGLRRRYLPSRLSVAVSSDDYQALVPFVTELRREMQSAFGRTAERPGFEALSPAVEVTLHQASELKLGSPPRFLAGFPPGHVQASWNPGTPFPHQAVHLPAPGPPAGSPEAAGSLRCADTVTRDGGDSVFKLVVTTASAESTGLQTVFTLCLDEALPAGCLEEDATSTLVLDAQGLLRYAAGQEIWKGLSPRVSELRARVPVELEGSVDIPPEARASKLCRFYRPGRPEVLWAPQGILLVGRAPELVHWVPPGAPPNLSGRHFALLRGNGRTLRVVDLGSTNGTYLAGRRLEPYERVRVAPPETVEVGVEGAMRLDLRFPG